ncbi:AAA family ATPase [Streptomyces sp. CC208A]|uniref:AAA family ATPase n=1 Tax=Streptomyces sp. CC208A TaxID=3044573 RepID=UPI0024A929F2|nr:AAA family ATPase [Streptomyces sp. CC208A]
MDNVRHMNRGPADDDGLTLTPPSFEEAEQGVLGAGMLDPRHIPLIRSSITGADFYKPAHELIWNVICDLYDSGQPTQPFIVVKELEKRKEIHRAGGHGYVSYLLTTATTSPSYYAEMIREAADLRIAGELGRKITQYTYEPDAEPARIVTFIDDYLKRQQERTVGRSGDPADALLAELLDASSLDNMPVLEPLVGDLLHLDSLARIIGPSGHMKSFVTIDIAAHVGTGKPWHGHHVRQGTVVYLVAEGARGIRKRVRAWEKHHGLKMDNVLFMPRPVQTRGPEWDVFIEAMRRLEPALIIIDTQARVSVGVEENSNTELGLVIERLDDLRRATEACVLVIHHTGHIGEHGRGASAAKGALQSEFHVSKKGDNASNIVVTMKVGKQKDDEEGADIQFGLKVVTLDGERKPDGRPVTSVVLESLDLTDHGPVPGTAAYFVAALDQANIPTSYGRDKLRTELVRLGLQARTEVLAEVARIRKTRGPGQVGDRSDLRFSQERLSAKHPDRPTHPENTPKNGQNTSVDLSPDLSPTKSAKPVPNPGTETEETPGQTCPGQNGDSTGQAVDPTCPLPPPLGRGQVEQPTPVCTVCNTPLHGYRLERGYTTCLEHDAA